MKESMFMKVSEVAKELEVSESYAYKLISRMNENLKKQGYITISGRIDRKYFHEQFYGTQERKEA